MIGFGSIGQGILPLIFKHIDISQDDVIIITANEVGKSIADIYGVNFNVIPLTEKNYSKVLKKFTKQGDFILNLSVNVSSIDIIKYCQSNDILYLDTCIEPWAGFYTNQHISPQYRSNYYLREEALKLKGNGPTALIAHGANPGLVSHFVKQALINIASDLKLEFMHPTNKIEWAELANRLNIKVIHIAEHDTQTSFIPKKVNEFVNTWSVDGFIAESCQPSELGWGTHEKYFPNDADNYDFGSNSGIYLNIPGASVKIRSWTPLEGAYHGFLITHNEVLSISDYFTLKNNRNVIYKPTVNYAYHPCDSAVLSIHELAENNWVEQHNKRLMNNDITDGIDTLGVLLMGNHNGVYWYGSKLSIQQARKLVPYNNATSLQVSISALAGMIWVINNPYEGVIESDDIDYEYILKICRPYLGDIVGQYSDWTPLQGRGILFSEDLDTDDPWQFKNIRV